MTVSGISRPTEVDQFVIECPVVIIEPTTGREETFCEYRLTDATDDCSSLEGPVICIACVNDACPFPDGGVVRLAGDDPGCEAVLVKQTFSCDICPNGFPAYKIAD